MTSPSLTARSDDAMARRRVIAAATIIVLHLTVAAFLTRPRSLAVTAPATAVMIVTAVSAPQSPQPVQHEALINPQIAPPEIEIAASDARTPPVCDLLAAIAAASRTDPATIEALLPIAAEPTHAIMAWNGAWSERVEIQPLRRAAVAVMATARTDCLDERQVGPRLIFIPIGLTSISVVFGSGSWSWRAMLSDDQQ